MQTRQRRTRIKNGEAQQDSETDDFKNKNIVLEMPFLLHDLLPQDKWNILSQQRKQDCLNILNQPNTFFYRERPPWETPKFGALSKEEDEQFAKRLKLFREEYGIFNSLWGYFSIPFIGRVGYQMASFYRAKVRNGEITDSYLEVDPTTGKLRQVCDKPKQEISQSIYDILNKEAAELIANELNSMKNLSSITVHKKRVNQTFDFTMGNGLSESDSSSSPHQKRQKRKKRKTKYTKKDEMSYETSNQTGEGETKELTQNLLTSSSISDTTSSDYEHLITDIKAGKDDEIQLMKQSLLDGTKYDSSSDDQDNDCILVGARDPITGTPMKKPAMNFDGYVMDFDSWLLFLNGKASIPYDTTIQSTKELIKITSKNYDSLKMNIANFNYM